MLDGQMRATHGDQRPHAIAATGEGWTQAPEPSRRGNPAVDALIPYGTTPPEPVRRLLEALAVYQVTRPDCGGRADRGATLH